MKKLFVIVCLFISSILDACQQNDFDLTKKIMESFEYKNLTKEWANKFKKITDPNFKGSLVDNPSSAYQKDIPKDVRIHLHQAIKARGAIRFNQLNMPNVYKLQYEQEAQYHEDRACKQYDAHLKTEIATLANRAKAFFPLAEGPATTLIDGQRTNISFKSPHFLTIQNKIAPTIKVKHARELCLTSEQVYRSEQEVLARQQIEQKEIDEQLQKVEQYRNDKKKVDRVQQKERQARAEWLQKKEMQRKRDEQRAYDKKRVALEQERLQAAKAVARKAKAAQRVEQRKINIVIAEEDQKRREEAIRIAQVKETAEKYVLDKKYIGCVSILESLQYVQSSTLNGLARDDKKSLQSFQKFMRRELFNSNDSIDNLDTLKPIVMQRLKQCGIDHQRLSDWAVDSMVNTARDGFEVCVKDCGSSFDGTRVFERIVKTTIDEEHFQTLSQIMKRNNIHSSDGNIRNLMEIQKQLLLGAFALQYKNSK
jgi:hypothetical protein